MESNISYIPATAIEATVSSKGQVTLPKALRNHLGIQKGSRIRFSLAPSGGLHASHVLYEFDDLWKLADQGTKAEGAKPREVMTFEEMNEAKARRSW
jgi:antitoxin PrlF